MSRKELFATMMDGAKKDFESYLSQGIMPLYANMSWMTFELIWRENESYFLELVTNGTFNGIPAKIDPNCLDYSIIYSLE